MTDSMMTLNGITIFSSCTFEYFRIAISICFNFNTFNFSGCSKIGKTNEKAQSASVKYVNMISWKCCLLKCFMKINCKLHTCLSLSLITWYAQRISVAHLLIHWLNCSEFCLCVLFAQFVKINYDNVKLILSHIHFLLASVNEIWFILLICVFLFLSNKYLGNPYAPMSASISKLFLTFDESF